MAFKTFTAGEIFTASDANTYLMRQAVVVCTAATRPSSPSEGMTIYETDTDAYAKYDGSAWVYQGYWQSYTPTITGDGGWTLGTPTVTASYARLGDTAFVKLAVVWGGGVVRGTGDINITLPINAAGTNDVTRRPNVGSAFLRDTSAALEYAGQLLVTTATTMQIKGMISDAGSDIQSQGLGTGGSLLNLTDTGDSFYGFLTYESV